MLCVSLGGLGFAECLQAVKANELCELRLDQLDLSSDELKQLFNDAQQTIATLRQSKDLSDKDRIKKLRTAIDLGATYVDVELDASDTFKDEVISYARTKNCKVIVSYHNCEKTPSKSELEHIIEWCKKYSPDVIKIACLSHSDRDNARLLSLLDSDVKMVAIGMGPKGSITRVVAPKLGAFCTYVSLTKESKTAPGQLTKDELKKFLDGLPYV